MIRFPNILLTRFVRSNLKYFSTSRIIFKDIAQSSFYKPIQKVQQFLNEQRIKYQTGASSFRIRQCLFCNQPHFNNLANLYTLNVDMNDGKFLCSRCKKVGSWDELKARVLNIGEQKKSKTLLQQLPSKQQISQIEYKQFINNLKSPEYAQVMQYLKFRGFNEETIEKYQIGTGIETFLSELGKSIQVKVIYFPMFEKQKQDVKHKQAIDQSGLLNVNMSKIKVRGASAENKKYTRQFPGGSKTGFFGLNTIAKTDKIVVITEGEFDAMAVNQQTGHPAISLPQGANNLPDRILPYLNQFTKIFLWMDNDEAGRLGADKISHKLGSKRTYVVKHNIENLKDANDFLKSCPKKMKEIIESSKTKPGQNVNIYSDYTDLVKERIYNQDKFKGIQIECIPFFNKKVKGLRMQEVTIVSGPTGCGKTTFLAQLSLDLSKKDIPVLWGSFQIRNEVLITNMMNQFAGVNLFRKKQLFDYYADQFKSLPIHWLNFHGSNDVDKVLATIQYSIEKYNVSFVVLDTLQFMLSDQAQGIKKFDLQDKVMSRLRKIATNYNVHIVVVIHPKKTQENDDIHIHSIYGTSKATQEADNIWIIQSRQNFRIFDVKKNRFDGDVGKVAIGYDKETRKFLQLSRNQIIALINKQTTISQIVEEKKLKKQAESNGQQGQEYFNLESPGIENEMQDDLIGRKKPKLNNR